MPRTMRSPRDSGRTYGVTIPEIGSALVNTGFGDPTSLQAVFDSRENVELALRLGVEEMTRETITNGLPKLLKKVFPDKTESEMGALTREWTSAIMDPGSAGATAARLARRRKPDDTDE